MAQIEAEANTSKGRGKIGGRSVRARGRGGRTSKSSQVTAFNSTFLNFLFREGYVPVQGHEGHEGDEEVQKPEELIIPRKKRSATDID